MSNLTPQQIAAILSLGSRTSGYGANYASTPETQGYLGQVSNYLGSGSNAFGIASGIQRGGFAGYGGAGINAANLYGRLTGSKALSPYTGALGSALGLYQGIERGGVAGDSQAALSAARLGLQGATATGAMSAASAAPYMSALGYAAIPLELYNFVQDEKSGRTGSDTLNGAETGAAIGSVIPGIGTVIGGIVGAAAGAIGSAFGPGAMDPENETWNDFVPQYNKLSPQQQEQVMSQLSPSQSMQFLQGVMDARDPTAGHSEELEQKYGRMQASSVMDAIANEINSAYKSGQIKPGESSSDIYEQVVNPWLNSQGIQVGYTAPGQQGYIVHTNQAEGPALQGVLTNLIGDYTSGSLNPSSRVGISGETISGLPTYLGAPAPQPSNVPAAYQTPMRPVMGAAGVGARIFSKGGSMKKRKFRYDDGGSYDDNSLDQVNLDNWNLPYYDTQDTANMQYPTPDYSEMDSGLTDVLPPDLSEYTTSVPSFDTEPQNGGASGAIGSLLQSFGLSPGIASTLASLGIGAAELSPILSSMFGGNSPNNGTPPATPAGYGSIPAIQTPNFSRQYTGPTTSSWNPEQWYKYGEGPEQSFFSNNQLPNVPGVSPNNASPPQNGATPNLNQQALTAPFTSFNENPGYGSATPISPGQTIPWGGVQGMPMLHAHGGAISQAMHDGPGYVDDPGFGDGTSDDVNARLSGGEYVMDGGTVSMLGNGSNEAGARKLDQLRQRLRQDAGRQLVKGKQFMQAKEPEHYLRGKGTKE